MIEHEPTLPIDGLSLGYWTGQWVLRGYPLRAPPRCGGGYPWP